MFEHATGLLAEWRIVSIANESKDVFHSASVRRGIPHHHQQLVGGLFPAHLLIESGLQSSQHGLGEITTSPSPDLAELLADLLDVLVQRLGDLRAILHVTMIAILDQTHAELRRDALHDGGEILQRLDRGIDRPLHRASAVDDDHQFHTC